MGYLKESSKLSRTSELQGVFSKLIRKAEKKKKTAQNYHVYALLQSTICKLRCDDVHYKSSKQRKSDFSKTTIPSTENIDQLDGEISDPMELDDFFVRLKSVCSRKDNVIGSCS